MLQVVQFDLPDVSTGDSIVRIALNILLAWVSDHFSSSFVQHITWAGHCSRLPDQVLRHVGVELLAGVHPRSWHPIVLNRLLAAVSNLLL